MGVRKEWEVHGFKCRVLDSPFQGYNGYVAVPKGHPIHGLSYNDFDINVHGGVTFSDFGEDKPNKEGEILWPNPELYWIGFDTAHYGDWVGYNPDMGGRKWSVEDVAQETEQMAKQLRQIMNGEKLKRDITEKESKQRLFELEVAINNLDGVKIPWNVIKNYIVPLGEWLDEVKSSG